MRLTVKFEPGGSAFGGVRGVFSSIVLILALVTIAAAQIPSLPNTNSALPTASPTPTATPSPTPIPLSAIVEQADATTAKLQEIRAFLSDSPRNSVIAERSTELANELGQRAAEVNDILRGEPSLDELNYVQREWDGYARTVTGWRSELQTQATELDKRITELKALKDVWERSLEAITKPQPVADNTSVQPPEAVPEQVIQRVNETIASIDEARKAADARRSDLLTLQTRVSDIEGRVGNVIADIKDSRSIALSKLFVRESPSIWGLGWSSLALSEIVRQTSVSVSGRVTDLVAYASAHTQRFVLHGVILLLLVAGLYWLRERVRNFVKKEPDLERSANVFLHPIATALLLTFFLSSVFYAQAPRLLLTLLGAIALVPVVVLLRKLIDRTLYLIVDILVVFYFFDRVRDVFSSIPVIARVLFILEMLAAAGILVWMWRSKRLASKIEAGEFRLYRWFGTTAPFLVGIFSIAALANIFGYVGLSNVIGSGILRSSYAALVLNTLVEVLMAVFDVVIRIHPLSRLRMMSDDRPLIRASVRRWLRWIAFAIWLLMTLNLISVRDVVMAWAGSVLAAGVSIGTFSITIGDLIAGVAAVWISFLVSRFIRFVLDEDVYPRMDLNAGVSYAISTMLHYAVVAIGFLIAIATLGVELSKFTIIVGAFSIGIGFGLQTIINNFVSGLIMLFERPVKVGDSVQIDEHLGELKQIGLRASVLRKVDGSDVILPNSMLISGEVINWTMSDKRRRIDIPVGVAYGTDAKMVMELLTGVATNEPDIIDEPAPVTLFKGFGDNSIDFELRGWTEDTERWVGLRSKLVTAVYAALNEANVEIPFPQRDVHLRSVDGDAAKGLKGGKGS